MVRTYNQSKLFSPDFSYYPEPIPNITAWQVEKTMAGWVWEAKLSPDGERDVRSTRSDAGQGTEHEDRYLRDSSFAGMRCVYIYSYVSVLVIEN